MARRLQRAEALVFHEFVRGRRRQAIEPRCLPLSHSAGGRRARSADHRSAWGCSARPRSHARGARLSILREAGRYISERFATVTKCAVLEHAIVLLMAAAASGRPNNRTASTDQVARVPHLDKVSLFEIAGADAERLLGLLDRARATVAARGCDAPEIYACYEAGYDGFWLHRLLVSRGSPQQHA
jgi:hypothetical protein